MRIFVSSNSTNLFQAPPHTQVNQGSSFGLAPLHAPPHFPPTHHNPPPFPYIAFPPSPPGGWHEKAMKVTQQFSTSCWDHETPTAPSSVFCCKRLRPLAPKLSIPDGTRPALDLRSFIKPESNLRNAGSGDERREPLQVEAQSGGTRWNPTQEQIGILEMLYKGGMRTPNAQQIEHITVQLGKYGKIEGKNVFYWFQNHKARERQKQKRNNHSLGTPPSCRGNNNKNPPQSPSTAAAGPGAVTDSTKCEAEKQEDSSFKRKWRSWGVHSMEVECRVHVSTCEDMTLELFPLHPESR